MSIFEPHKDTIEQFFKRIPADLLGTSEEYLDKHAPGEETLLRSKVIELMDDYFDIKIEAFKIALIDFRRLDSMLRQQKDENEETK